MSRLNKVRLPTMTQSTPRHGDTGLTLIEVVVAMALFLILAASSTSVLLVALRTTEVNRDRVAAANLAGRELEIVRNQFTSATRGPETITLNQTINENPLYGPAGSPMVLDNVTYTVTRTVQWSAVGATAASTCDDGTSSELAYLHVNIKVAWARMGGNPISMDTILTPPKGTYSTTTGHIGVKIVDAAGSPGPGHTVTIDGPSGTQTGVSAADGCTVFAFLTPGAYTITVNEATFVNRAGEQLATATATVQVGQMVRSVIDYGKSATILANLTTDPAYALPAINDIPLTLGNSYLPSGSMVKTGTGNNRTVVNLWPFPSGYQFWAGTCLDADPQYTQQIRADAVTSNPGGLTSATVDLAALNVAGANPGATITAVHAPDTACPTGATITLGTATAAGTLATSAPYGQWAIKTSTRNGSVTLVRGDPPPTATLT